MKDIKHLISVTADEFSDDESINKHKLEQSVWDALLSDEENREAYLEVLAFEALKGITGTHFNRHVKALKGMSMTQLQFQDAHFRHIQPRYAVTVNDETEMVSTQLMTENQFNEQITLHKKQGLGHYQHAEELVKLKDMIHGGEDSGSANDPTFFDVDHNEEKP